MACLGKITQEVRYQKLAIAALNYWQICLQKKQVWRDDIGGFSGLGSVIYSLSHLAIQLNQPQLISVAREWLNYLPEIIAQDEQWDIIAGSAGCILGLLSLYAVAPDSQILDVAIQCGDRLIAGARPQETGIGWIPANIRSQRPLTGFSHGAAGIAYALLELAAVTQLERFEKAATAAIAYERSVFDPHARNWPDFREFDPAPKLGKQGPLAWSHGAPGIGLARLYGLKHHDDRQIRQEIYTALDITCDRGFGQNHSLAQGDLGNLELVLQASLTLGEPQWHSHLHRIGGTILESIQSDGWLCRTPLGVETPGLMSGLAGIGYGLLRLAQPETVSSVLALRPPIFPPQSGDSEGI